MTLRVGPWILTGLALGCHQLPLPDLAGETGETGETGGESDHACLEAAARVGGTPCVQDVPDVLTWSTFSLRAGDGIAIRSGKHLIAARPDGRLPTMLVDPARWRLHEDFIAEAFPDRFPGFDGRQYDEIILQPATREVYAGTIDEYRPAGATLWTYGLWDDPRDPGTLITCADLVEAHAELERHFALRPLMFAPWAPHQIHLMAECDVPAFDPAADLAYEVYTTAVGFGTVRRLSLSDLALADAAGEIGDTDVLVLDGAPLDLDTPIAGVVTGARQGALSHLAVRTAARGTPNCYLQGAFDLLEIWDDELVRLECGVNAVTVEAATLEEAEAHWQSTRPDPIDVPEPDAEHRTIVGALEVPTTTADDRALAVRRYGGKGSNLAILYQRTDPALQVRALLVPFAPFVDFASTAGWEVDVGAGSTETTFAATVAAWVEDPEFRGDRALRRARLEALRAAMVASSVDPAVVEEIGDAIVSMTGDPATAVRLRSSSNAEDSPEFPAAGLYESATACPADDRDGDEVGPSACDPSESDERGVGRALTVVWASLYSHAAWEEREYFGIDQRRVAMAVLVNDRSEGESANAVAFTGIPSAPADPRFLIQAQVGEVPVVSPPADVRPESVLLSIEDGRVVRLQRLEPSSLQPSGAVVLSDDELERMGAELIRFTEVLPVDHPTPAGFRLMFDSEWKVLADERLIVKQVRPFLAALPE